MGVDEVWENQAIVKVKKTKVGCTDYKVKVSSCNNIVAAPVYFHKEKTQNSNGEGGRCNNFVATFFFKKKIVATNMLRPYVAKSTDYTS